MFNLTKNYNKFSTLYKISTCNYSILTKTLINCPKHYQIPTYFTLKTPKQFYCSNEVEFTTEEINEITNGDEEQITKLKVLLLESEVMRQEGKAVPSHHQIKISNWKELLSKESRSGRRKYFEYLFKVEKKNENRTIKKEQRRLEKLERVEEPVVEDGSLRYDLGHNNMFLRIYDSTMNNMYNNKLFQAMQFSQKLVIDCGYHENMTKRENINCAKQLMLVFADNRAHDEPFDLHYCNLKKNAVLEDYTHRFIPTMYDLEFPFNAHECSYLDLFPKDKIVYLTPHCREELNEFDHDAVYVIGGIVDKVNNEPLSLAKAKKEGLKMAKLPLDKYLMWGSGSGKSLTLNQVLSIMLDMRRKNDWNHALRHVPKRKLITEDEFEAQRQQNPRYGKDTNRWRHSRSGDFNPNLSNPRKSPAGSAWRPKIVNETQQCKERLIHLKNILQD